MKTFNRFWFCTRKCALGESYQSVWNVPDASSAAGTVPGRQAKRSCRQQLNKVDVFAEYINFYVYLCCGMYFKFYMVKELSFEMWFISPDTHEMRKLFLYGNLWHDWLFCLCVFLLNLLQGKYVEHVREQVTQLFPQANWNKYLYNGKSVIKVNTYIHISDEKF